MTHSIEKLNHSLCMCLFLSLFPTFSLILFLLFLPLFLSLLFLFFFFFSCVSPSHPFRLASNKTCSRSVLRSSRLQLQMQIPRIRRAGYTKPFSIWDLSIFFRFWCARQVLEPIPCRYPGMTVYTDFFCLRVALIQRKLSRRIRTFTSGALRAVEANSTQPKQNTVFQQMFTK